MIPAKNKKLAVALAFGGSFILFSTIYLPYFSGISNKSAGFQEDPRLKELNNFRASTTKGSMWKQMDQQIKNQNQSEKSE